MRFRVFLVMAGSKNVLHSHLTISNLKPLLALCPTWISCVSFNGAGVRWGEQLQSKNIKGLWSKLQSKLKGYKRRNHKNHTKKNIITSYSSNHLKSHCMIVSPLPESLSWKLQSNTDSFMEIASLQVTSIFWCLLFESSFFVWKCARKMLVFGGIFWGTLPWNFFWTMPRFSAT